MAEDLHWEPATERKPATKPFSLRLSEEERLQLIGRAGHLPLGAYIRNQVLGESAKSIRVPARSPVKDDQALGRVLAMLGQSRIANNLNQIAKAVNIGALPVTPETEAEIGAACHAVRAMRADLMRALGLADGGAP